MELIVGIAIFVLIAFLIQKKIKRKTYDSASRIRAYSEELPAAEWPDAEEPLEEAVYITSDSESVSFDIGDLQEVGPQQWVINPNSPFPLTITGVERATATAIHRICRDGNPFDTSVKKNALLPFIARCNLQCQEIQDFIAEVRPQYLKALHQWQQASPEWQAASALDKEDLSIEISGEILKRLPVNPGVNIALLLNGPPEHPAYDDALIDRFGFAILQTYLKYGNRGKALYRIPASHRARAEFNALTQSGLARQGHDIPIPELLQGLTMKELNQLAASESGGKVFRQKAKAIAALQEVEELDDRLSSMMAVREWFKILPLPSDFSHLDLNTLAASWKYDEVVATLMATTVIAGNRYLNNQAIYTSHGLSVSEWSIQVNCQNCRLCEEEAARIGSSQTPPRVPIHVGCWCSIRPGAYDREPSLIG